MDVHSEVFFPASFNELFSAWNSFPDAVLYAGGTDLTGRQGKNYIELPPVIISLDKFDDLRRITRTEKYLEIGAMVKLNRLIQLGKTVPEILCRCLEEIAGVQLRNIATIGGNICCSNRFLDTAAPLTALDAQFELRCAASSRWVSASRFYDPEGGTALGKGELLTRIRLPLEQWDYSVYKKFPSSDIYNSEVMVFLAKIRKNILNDIRIVFKSRNILRNKKSEGSISGKNMPLSRKITGDFVHNWKEFLSEADGISEFTKNEIISFVELNIFNLSE